MTGRHCIERENYNPTKFFKKKTSNSVWSSWILWTYDMVLSDYVIECFWMVCHLAVDWYSYFTYIAIPWREIKLRTYIHRILERNPIWRREATTQPYALVLLSWVQRPCWRFRPSTQKSWGKECIKSPHVSLIRLTISIRVGHVVLNCQLSQLGSDGLIFELVSFIYFLSAGSFHHDVHEYRVCKHTDHSPTVVNCRLSWIGSRQSCCQWTQRFRLFILFNMLSYLVVVDF
jgi:hypothetical protein